MRKFYTTSEFWTAIIPSVFGLIAMSGVLTPEKASEAARLTMTIVGAILAGIGSSTYVAARSELKQAVTGATAATYSHTNSLAALPVGGVSFPQALIAAGV